MPKIVRVVPTLNHFASLGALVGRSKDDWVGVREYLRDRGVLSFNDLDDLSNMRSAFLEASGHLSMTVSSRASQLVRDKCKVADELLVPSMSIIEKLLKDDQTLGLPLRSFTSYEEQGGNDKVVDPSCVSSIMRRAALFKEACHMVFGVEPDHWKEHFKECCVMAKVAVMDRVIESEHTIREMIVHRFLLQRVDILDKERKLEKHLYRDDLIDAIKHVYKKDGKQEWRLCSYHAIDEPRVKRPRLCDDGDSWYGGNASDDNSCDADESWGSRSRSSWDTKTDSHDYGWSCDSWEDQD